MYQALLLGICMCTLYRAHHTLHRKDNINKNTDAIIGSRVIFFKRLGLFCLMIAIASFSIESSLQSQEMVNSNHQKQTTQSTLVMEATEVNKATEEGDTTWSIFDTIPTVPSIFEMTIDNDGNTVEQEVVVQTIKTDIKDIKEDHLLEENNVE